MSRLPKVLIGMSILALSFFGTLYILSLGPRERPSALERDARLLDRVIFLDRTKLADLSRESAEILYRPQTEDSRLTLRIPPDGVLDTAIGVDPLITDLFTGHVDFELSLVVADGEPQVLFRKDLDISSWSEADFVWNDVEIDVSQYSGMDASFVFSKGYAADHHHQPEQVYDLLPIDFMYWRKPTLRPQRLADRHNVILISLDTLRADHLHFLGYGRQTSPNLDRIARTGTFFTTVVTQAPWTTPAHWSMLTSRYPSVHEAIQPFHDESRTWNKTLPTLASILREKGYLTAAFTGSGSISAEFGLYKGFDSYNETNPYDSRDEADCGGGGDAERVFGQAAEWLSENRDRTFFLFAHTYEPHYPYCEEFFVRKEQISPADTVAHRTARYDGDIRRADFFVGGLLDRLNSLDLLDRTLVVITSDHGEDLDPPKEGLRHGHHLYDGLLLVPLVLYSPAIIPSGRQVDHQVRSIDILPTILEYLEYPADDQFDGRSLKGMIDGHDERSRPAYSEATLYGTERESLRVNGYKYVYRVSYGQLSHPYSLGLPVTPLHELYDLRADPFERVNLADQDVSLVEEHQQLISDLFPERSFSRRENEPKEGIDVSKNDALMKRLRSLGYVR